MVKKNLDYYKKVVTVMYEVLLDRKADVGGLKMWSEKLLKGEIDDWGLAYNIIQSPEYQMKYHATNKK